MSIENFTRDLRDPEVRALRIERIKQSGQFGHGGRHRGNGSPGCPREPHHHHDIFCAPPTRTEWSAAGKTGKPVWGSRA